jgi:hypothetical protein
MSIATEIRRLLEIPTRQQNVVSSYLLMLMSGMGRRTLTAAAKLSGLAISQFSRLLSGHKALACENLNRLSRRRLKRLLGKRKRLVSGAPWSVAIIIDATLHERSSRHLENAQKFNHGDGWVLGHQWTNIVICINNETIPLPPLPFLTKKYCKAKGFKYKTEHQRIIDFLASWDWESVLMGVKASEVVVLTDSGYDNKELQTFVKFQGWDFVGSLKKSRSVQTATQSWQSVADLFRRTRKIGLWQTIRTNGGKKRKEFRARTLTGVLKGVPFQVELVCSEKPNGERLFLACSLEGAPLEAIVRAYKIRWRVEIFHKEIKSYLGFEDAGLTTFDAIEAHVYWVYCSYLLLLELSDDQAASTLSRKTWLQDQLRNEEIGHLLHLNSRFDNRQAIKAHCLEVRRRLMAA